MSRWLFFAIVFVAGVSFGLSACGPEDSASKANKDTDPTVVQGAALIDANGCLGCHSLNGAKRSGPTFKGIAGSQVTLTNGQTVTADDTYLHKAIADPDSEVIKGYPKGVMASAMGSRKALTPEQINAMVAYLNTVK